MSDFIYSKCKVEKNLLTKEIQQIYHYDKPSVNEFHGEWGSLAVSENIYDGFQPYETDSHICVILGGPLLNFRDKPFEDGRQNKSNGTKFVFERVINGKMNWDDDLNGPFSVLLINKINKNVECITDLMSFIPIYVWSNLSNIALSSHTDVLARVTGQVEHKDLISEADFILHGTVTYPYTIYREIKQLAPASIHSIEIGKNNIFSHSYWLPKEEDLNSSLNQTADRLRNSLRSYVNDVVNDLPSVAHFISGGEDSRVLAGLLPQNLRKDAFVFLDNMNREGKLAKKAALAYNSNFNLAKRTKLHYMEIMPECSDIVGSGAQYIHAHTFGFQNSCKLNQYKAVFGGLFSDALLKGARIKKRGSKRFPFMPQKKNINYSPAKTIINKAFNSDVLKELTQRRKAHLKYIKTFRDESAEEWFELWPSSMNVNIPNLHVNRRLFRSYEPFMSKEVVKISTSVPQEWKLNRKLFHKTAKPLLKETKWLLHSEGKLPYFSWRVNIFLQFIVWGFRQFGRKTRLTRGNQGPWTDWNAIMKSEEWQEAIMKYSQTSSHLSTILKVEDVKELFNGKELSNRQKVNLLQSLYYKNKI